MAAWKVSDRVWICAGALCWIAKLEFFAAEYAAASAWPGYSLRDSTISMLGAQVSPHHAVMNAGLVLAGLLTIAGAVLTRKAWPEGWLAPVALGLIVIAGLGTVGVGLFPVDGNETLHIAATLTTFLPGGAGVIVLGETVYRTRPLFGAVTVLFGVTSLMGLLLFSAHLDFGLGRGGMERVTGYASTLWYVVAGTVLLFTTSRQAAG